MKLENKKDYKERVECVIQEGNNILTIKYGNDNDLYLSMDYYDKEEESDKIKKDPKKTIQYDGEFTLKMGILKRYNPNLFEAFEELFKSIKAERNMVQ